MKRLIPLMFLFSLLVVSCGTSPQTGTEPVQQPGPVEPVPEAPAPEEAPGFDPGNVSRDVYEITKAEVEELVGKLNVIIAARDYNAWVSYLDEGYFGKISSPAFLQEISDSELMKIQKKVIRTPREYFLNVVVPSRSNDRVDDISFITKDRVRVIQFNQRRRRPPSDPDELAKLQTAGADLRDGWLYENSREIFYELEKIQNVWKIVD
jgi:hypothetical protein